MPKKGRRSDYRIERHSESMSAPPRRLAEGLDEADDLMRAREWRAARDLLRELDQRHPNKADVLVRLVNVSYELQDNHGYAAACQQLVRLTPRDVDANFSLIGAYMAILHPALALRQARYFIEHFLNDPHIAEASALITDLDLAVEKIMAGLGLDKRTEFDFACQHEEMQVLIDQGRHAQARQLGEQMLLRRPDFTPVMNNLSLIHYTEGNLDRAIEMSRRVLAFAPDNYHALSNLARYLCLSGRLDEAKQIAEQLKRLDFGQANFYTKQAEALSFLGDDEAVMAAVRCAEHDPMLKTAGGAFLLHLGAVAAMRLGDEKEARHLWKRALDVSPGLDLARDNLDDLRNPVGERNAPYPFEFRYWLREQILRDLMAEMGPATKRDDDEEVMQRAARRVLRKHPELEALAPMLLDRGDEPARQFALMLAQAARTPKLLEALRDFALSPRGTDDQRMQAGRTAREAGLLPSKVRLWVKGEQQELLLMGFQIHREPNDYDHRPHVQELALEAIRAMHDGKFDKAETVLKQALALEPDAPDLLTNLSRVYEAQDKQAEADAMILDVHRRFPDYFFGRIGAARIHIHAGRFDEAKALLDPLLEMTRIHVSEFAALAVAEAELHLAEGRPEGAQQWLDMLERIDPDNPAVGYLARRLASEKGVGRVVRRALGRK
jgi:tetratricopeptide (TPR) repeat protein